MGLCEHCGVCAASDEPHKCLPVAVKLEKPEVIVIKEECFEDDFDEQLLSLGGDPLCARTPKLSPPSSTKLADAESLQIGPRLKCPHCRFQPGHLATLNNHLTLWHTKNENDHPKRHYYKSDAFQYSQTPHIKLQQQGFTENTRQHDEKRPPRQVLFTKRVFVARHQRRYIDNSVRFKRYYECLHCSFKSLQDAAVKEHVSMVHCSAAEQKVNLCE